MKFGTVLHPELIDFTLPPDHPDTNNILHPSDRLKPLNIFVGCAKWNKTDLKNLYPRETKDELADYFILKLNRKLGTKLKRPEILTKR